MEGVARPELSDVVEFLRWLTIADALHDGRGDLLVVPLDKPERLLPLMDDALGRLDGVFRWHSFVELGGNTVVNVSGRVELLGRLALVHFAICARNSFGYFAAPGAAVLDARDN